MAKNTKQERRKKLHNRIRKRISGTSACPRLSVYRSNKDVYAQLIDDVEGITLLSASSSHLNKSDVEQSNKSTKAKMVGITLANKAKEKGISTVVFDRSGYLYHGRVKSLAEGAREGGLKF